MSIKIVLGMIAVVTALATIAITTTTSLANSVFAQGGEQKFMAKISGQDEVPPTDSQATGMAEFTLMGTDSV